MVAGEQSKLVLVVGGSRSGKSDFALALAESMPIERYFLATCPSSQGDDAEMARRITGHQQKRANRGWQTCEEELELCRVVERVPDRALLLIDCLTLWISNLLFVADRREMVDEDFIARKVDALLESCRLRMGPVIMVSGEVGCGIVPENRLARRYRDLVGRCNQLVADAADQVFMVSCGVPLTIKG